MPVPAPRSSTISPGPASTAARDGLAPQPDLPEGDHVIDQVVAPGRAIEHRGDLVRLLVQAERASCRQAYGYPDNQRKVAARLLFASARNWRMLAEPPLRRSSLRPPDRAHPRGLGRPGRQHPSRARRHRQRHRAGRRHRRGRRLVQRGRRLDREKTTYARENLFAYDLATGRVLPGFAPQRRRPGAQPGRRRLRHRLRRRRLLLHRPHAGAALARLSVSTGGRWPRSRPRIAGGAVTAWPGAAPTSTWAATSPSRASRWPGWTPRPAPRTRASRSRPAGR